MFNPFLYPQVVAEDADSVDSGRLIYSVGGEGVGADPSEGSDPFFSINPHSGELLQLKPLDRDPPTGKASWKLRVQVRDGQRVPSSLAAATKRLPKKIPAMSLQQGESTNSLSSLDSFSPSNQTLQGNESISVDISKESLLPSSIPHKYPFNTDNSLKGSSDPIHSFSSADGKPRRIPPASVEALLPIPSLFGSPVSASGLDSRKYPSNNERGSDISGQIRRKRDTESMSETLISPFNITTNARSHRSSGSTSPGPALIIDRYKAKESNFLQAYRSNLNTNKKLTKRTNGNRNYKLKNKLGHSNIENPMATKDSLSFNSTHLFVNTQNTFQSLLPVPWVDPRGEHQMLLASSSLKPESPLLLFPNGVKDTTRNRAKRSGMETRPIEGALGRVKRSSVFEVPRGALEPRNGSTEPEKVFGKIQDLNKPFPGKRFSPESIGGCEDYTSFSFNFDADEIPKLHGNEPKAEEDIDLEKDLGSHMLGEDDETGHVHVVETVVTVIVKDLNDNPPLFPNMTIIGEVQENGPIDLSVAVVTAWDADDVEEGNNARLTYSIGKNVLEERTGQAIFDINPKSGLLTTAVCCLDRETTPEYHIQVVAVDGGGLTGTGQVVVRLADVNDNSPRLSRDLWEVDVEESWRGDSPSNRTLTQITTVDHDISNYFFYRVVEESGWGWQYFDVRSRGHIGELYSTHPLDYEDSAHRRGFRFMIQVTDRGRGGWDDPRHTDTAWVSVRLLDINDNPPQFSQPQIHLTLQEDLTPGTVLTNLVAQDPDKRGKQSVHYDVVGAWDSLRVSDDGVIRLWKALDREKPGGDVGVAQIIAVDDGVPPMTSTATLTITVSDVNDCPPRLLLPTLLHVTEGRPPARLGLLRATDDDVWALGHGPPFFFSLSPSNPSHVFQMLALKYNSTEDSGRGGAEIWTKGALDREQYPQLTVDIEVSDAGGLSATQPVTVIVDDINDNPMKPGSKTVYLWKTQGGGSEASLGRVYVDDPDDWDLVDKTFAWHGTAHPLFSLHPDSGAIFASAHLREGRYELQFSVSDRTWGQKDVRANVTVDVRYLHQDALTHALPMTLTPITPTALTKGWSPKREGGGLGTLSKVVKEIVGISSAKVEMVSIYGYPDYDAIHSSSLSKAVPLVHSPVSPFACVWLSVRQPDGSYLDPVKLQGLLALHNRKLEKAMSVGVSLREPAGEAGLAPSVISTSSASDSQQPSSLASLASTALPLQVVDTNSTSVVTPRLSRSRPCPPHLEEELPNASCSGTSCFNGGRCVRNSEGNSRCICPGGSWGRRCKILSRTFQGNGWAWIRPFPPCLPTTLSLRVLTKRPNALIFYSGPLSFSSTHPRYPTTPMITLELINRRPQALLESARGSIRLSVDTVFEAGIWHTLHLHIDTQGVTLMVDFCDGGWMEGAHDDAHCAARASWDNPNTTEDWIGSDPVQLGGLSHSRPSPKQYGWLASPSDQGLDGCISHLTINGQLIDLGGPAYSSNSKPGCQPQEDACNGKCGLNGRCAGGLASPWCDCNPGWAPPLCDTPSIPTAFNRDSFVKMVIKFTPDPYSITSQLRVRALGRPNGLLLKLENRQRTTALVIKLRSGVVCAAVITEKEAFSLESCLEEYPLGDGAWHAIYVARHGPNLLLSVDDSDGWRRNHTLPSLRTSLSSPMSSSTVTLAGRTERNDPRVRLASSQHPLTSTPYKRPVPLVVDKQNGVSVGGLPEYQEAKLLNVHDDTSDICIDDIRISGKGLPLPPTVNETDWGHVTNFQNLESNCPSHDFCSNTSCLPPLTCHNSWRQSSCSCGPGRQLQGSTCQLVNECVYRPCLHGGTCHDLHLGYRCTCQPYHNGDNCQWVQLPPYSQSVTPMVITAVTLSILIFVVIGVVVTLRLHKSRAGRSGELRHADVEDTGEVGGGLATVIETAPISAHSNKRKEEPVLLDVLKLKVQAEYHSYEGSRKSPSLSLKGCSPKESHYHHHTSSLRRSTVGLDTAKNITPSNLKLPPRVTLCSSEYICKSSKSPAGTPEGIGTDEGPRVAVVCGQFSTYPPPATDDLRAYAYEGDGSPSGSLNSATNELTSDLRREEDLMKPIVPEYEEVFNLLKNLPDATRSNISKDASFYASLPRRTSSDSFPSQTVSGQIATILGKEVLLQDSKQSPGGLAPLTAASEQTEAASKQTHTRRKSSSLTGMSTPC